MKRLPILLLLFGGCAADVASAPTQEQAEQTAPQSAPEIVEIPVIVEVPIVVEVPVPVEIPIIVPVPVIVSDDFRNNGLFCDGRETYSPSRGCEPGIPPDCNDGLVCTEDTCDEANDVCANTPVDSTCDDGVFCNGAELCAPDSGCVSGLSPCSETVICDEVNDRCLAEGECRSAIDCDFPNEYCSKPRCEHNGQCTPLPENCGRECAPVCGCFGAWYRNECFAALHFDSPGGELDFSLGVPLCGGTDFDWFQCP